MTELKKTKKVAIKKSAPAKVLTKIPEVKVNKPSVKVKVDSNKKPLPTKSFKKEEPVVKKVRKIRALKVDGDDT